MAVGAAAMLGERTEPRRVVLVKVHEFRGHHPAGEPQGGFDGIREALLGAFFHGKAVDDDIDVMLVRLCQGNAVGESVHLPVDEHTGVAVRTQLVEELRELTLAPLHHRGEHLESRAFRISEQGVHDLLRRLRLDDLPAFRAVRDAGAREKQPEIIVDFRDGSHGGARVAVRCLLVDGDRGAETFDEVHIRLVHLPKELTRVGGQRLHIAPLPFGKQRVECQR